MGGRDGTSAGVDLASSVKVLHLLRAGEALGDALRAVGHAGKEAAVVAETIAKNLMDELGKLVPDLDLGLQPHLAGGHGFEGLPPVDDAAAAGSRRRNPAVEALYPEGWWDRGKKGSNAHAMSKSADDDYGSSGIDPELWPLGERPEVRGMQVENEPPLPITNSKRASVEELDVDLKGGSSRRLKDVVGDGLERDHWPSFAAIEAALVKRIGGPLDPKVQRFLYENTNTIAIDEALHKLRRTTGGRNSPAQVAADAGDLRAAFEADAQDFRRLGLEYGLTLEEVDETIEAMRSVNDELGIYTWVE